MVIQLSGEQFGLKPQKYDFRPFCIIQSLVAQFNCLNTDFWSVLIFHLFSGEKKEKKKNAKKKFKFLFCFGVPVAI